MRLLLAIIRCKECGYKTLTGYEQEESLEQCRKCGGKLEVLAMEEKTWK